MQCGTSTSSRFQCGAREHKLLEGRTGIHGPSMSEAISIFCDESCHLEFDQMPFMILGAISCPESKIRETKYRIREIKDEYGVSARTELKWTKVSQPKLECYLRLIDYFFDDDDLRFRGIVCDKSQLAHDNFGQDHDDWYYKMYYQLLRWFLDDENRYQVYLDIKDTKSAEKARRLHDILCNSQHDFHKTMLERIQHVRSHEVQLLQLSDILIGAVAYANRNLESSQSKVNLVERIRLRSHHSLIRTNYSKKFNIFHWRGRSGE